MAADKSIQVCVLGGGVIGLSVATHLLETYRDSMVVTVIADKYTPDTIASDKSASLILPSLFSKDCINEYMVWLRTSLDRFDTLYNNEDQFSETGLSHISGYYIKPDTMKGKPTWFKDLIPSYHEVTNSPNNRVLQNFDNKELVNCSTFTIAPSQYMEYLINRIKLLGGVLVTQRIESTSSLNSYHAIINCTGLGARELACDPNLYPSKGILVSVKAPWVKEWVLEGVATTKTRVFVIPRSDVVVLGGFNELNTEDTLMDEDKVKDIIDGCSTIYSSLSKANVISAWCGTRPMRKGGVRLEQERDSVMPGTVVIHNYGHGAHGMSLSWGCAVNVGNILGQALGLEKKHYVFSKL